LKPYLNKSVENILAALQKNGFRSLVAGGSVRDFLMGMKPSDYDILTDASIEQIRSVFKPKKVKVVGKTFEICLINNIEVAPARGKTNASFFPEQDLAMRDFTINSMAYEPGTDNIIDLFAGKKDLENKIVRFTNNPYNRIEEDPLRMIRACRFASQINGEIEPLSKIAILKNHGLIKSKVSFERIRLEILKSMNHKAPSLFFKSLYETGLLQYIFPSVARCFDLDGGPYHGETVFEHSMITGDSISSKYPLLRLAGYLHDAGKYDAVSRKNGRISFAGHENHTDMIKSDLEKLRFSNREIQYLLSIVAVHMRPLTEETTPKSVRKILQTLHQYNIDYHDFLRIRIADKKGNLAKDPYTFSEIKLRLKKILQEINPDKENAFTLKDLQVSGRDIMKILNINQGTKVGQILDSLLERVIKDPGLNSRVMLEKIILEYK